MWAIEMYSLFVLMRLGPLEAEVENSKIFERTFIINCLWTLCWIVSFFRGLYWCRDSNAVSYVYNLPSNEWLILNKMWNRFVRGDQYAIALALLDEGKVVVGALGCPNLPLASIASTNQQPSQGEEVGCLFFAQIGSGTYMQTLDNCSTATKVDASPHCFQVMWRPNPSITP